MSSQPKRATSFERSVGGLLKARRRKLGMTLQELAEKAELSAAFLSQAENGKATPSIVSLINIAKALFALDHLAHTIVCFVGAKS